MGVDLERTRVKTRLRTPIPRKLERTRYLPAHVSVGGVELLPWKGSADQFALSKANALAVIPEGKAFEAGEEIECMVI